MKLDKNAFAALAVSACLVVAGLGYGVADALDVVPGILTVKPAPPAVQPLPHVDWPEAAATPDAPTPTPGPPIAPGAVAAVSQTFLTDLTAALTRPAAAPAAPTDGDEPASGPAPASAPLRVGLEVRDTLTDDQLFAVNAEDLLVPASNTKLLAVLTALDVLGPSHRFTTSTVLADGVLTLVGGGDQLLGLEVNRDFVRAATGTGSLTRLAQDTATQLRAANVTTVALQYDASIWGDQLLLDRWIEEGTTRYEAPLVGLALDSGRRAGSKYAAPDPAADAAAAFAAALTDAGITVTGAPTPGAKPAQGRELATITSAPLAIIIRQILKDSDNTAADGVCRAAALQAGHDPSFAGAVQTVGATAAKYGLPTDQIAIEDCSGLSGRGRISAHALAATVQTIATVEDNYPIREGLPISGLDGTLAKRFPDRDGAGVVHAKTGTLSGVHSLAGYLRTDSGRQLSFAVIVNNFDPGALDTVKQQLDRYLAGLAGL